jgi:hypothetical protein
MKKCYTCRELCQASDFSIRRDNKDGRNNHCKKCRNEKNRETYKRHGKKHYKSSYAKSKRRMAKLVEMSGGKCNHCRRVYPSCVYDFHHIKKKSFNLKMSKMSKAWDKIVAEWEKTVMICSNCHRVEHHG